MQNTRNPAVVSPRVSPALELTDDANHRVQSITQPTGNRILGIWRLGQCIHQSSFAQHFLAQPADAEGSPRFDYVLRTIPHDRTVRSDAAAHLQNYALAASATSHPHLIAVLDSCFETASPYLVMPRLHGVHLGQVFTDDARQPLPVILWIARQAAQALAALHDASWVHGDIKPENLFVSSHGHLTVLDLGFATRIGSSLSTSSDGGSANRFMGTPRYAAPELSAIDSALPSSASDVYSLGRVLLELLAWSGPTIKNQAALEPIAQLVSEMIHDDASARPVAQQVESRIHRLEIENLNEYIQPTSPLRMVA